MKENSIEEDIILLKDFTEGNFKRDKLENYKGSCKVGYFYCKDIQQALDNLLSDYKRVLKENKELKEYIAIAPNLDEMTAVKYRNIQQDAYIKGRAEEQQRAEQIIHENYIPIQKVKEMIDELTRTNIEDNESVKIYEKMRRNTTDTFYKKSYQNSINKLNAQIETRKHIINDLQELLKGGKI